MIILRPDQQRLKSGIYEGWQNGLRNMLAVLPTGGGKSVIVSDIALDGNNAGMRQVIMAHRNELIAQMSHHVARRGIYHNVIGDEKIVKAIRASHRDEFGLSFVHPTAPCTVSSVQTLLARSETLQAWGMQQDRITIDEAHHVQRENQWGKAFAMFPNANGLGVTATAGRPDGGGLGRGEQLPGGKWTNDGIFDHIVFGPEMRWLINNGALTDYEIVCPPSDLHIDEDDITNSGDFSPKKLKAASEKSKIVGDVVREYTRYALFKRARIGKNTVSCKRQIRKRI
jgi:superfamily II DNA or RNA helicase